LLAIVADHEGVLGDVEEVDQFDSADQVEDADVQVRQATGTTASGPG
jgi:hypothetical protein